MAFEFFLKRVELHSHPTKLLITRYVTFKMNIINVAFLSPSLMIASGADGGVSVYFIYVGFAVLGPVLLFLLNRGVKKKA